MEPWDWDNTWKSHLMKAETVPVAESAENRKL
jgi:hypothetical protein